jgi:hypothetical protein
MRKAAWVRMIMPGPAGGKIDLQTNRPAETFVLSPAPPGYDERLQSHAPSLTDSQPAFGHEPFTLKQI